MWKNPHYHHHRPRFERWRRDRLYLATGAVEVSPTLPGTPFTFWAPRIPASFMWALSTSIFWRHIWKLFLLINLFSVTPPETDTKNPTQSFILAILAQHVLTYIFLYFVPGLDPWPWSRAVRTLFELSFLWKYSRQLVFVLEEVLLIIGLLIFSAQLVSLGRVFWLLLKDFCSAGFSWRKPRCSRRSHSRRPTANLGTTRPPFQLLEEEEASSHMSSVDIYLYLRLPLPDHPSNY